MIFNKSNQEDEATVVFVHSDDVAELLVELSERIVVIGSVHSFNLFSGLFLLPWLLGSRLFGG